LVERAAPSHAFEKARSERKFRTGCVSATTAPASAVSPGCQRGDSDSQCRLIKICGTTEFSQWRSVCAYQLAPLYQTGSRSSRRTTEGFVSSARALATMFGASRAKTMRTREAHGDSARPHLVGGVPRRRDGGGPGFLQCAKSRRFSSAVSSHRPSLSAPQTGGVSVPPLLPAVQELTIH